MTPRQAQDLRDAQAAMRRSERARDLAAFGVVACLMTVMVSLAAFILLVLS